MVQLFVNGGLCKKLLILPFLIIILLTALPPGLSKENEDETIDVVWLVDGIITAEEFPIGIYDARCNFTIQTSWGVSFTGISNQEYPYLIWLSTPKTPSSGTGTVILYIEDELRFNKSISWDLQFYENLTPVNVSFKYSWFSFWVGTAFLTGTFGENHHSQFQYEIITNYNNRTQYMPYDENFEFLTSLNSSDWDFLTKFLITNHAYNWQSWNFPPDDYSGANYGMCDGGGYRLVVTIEWNDSSISNYSNYVDNDGCSGKRIYSNKDGTEFSDSLLSLSDKYIKVYLSSKDETEKEITKIDFVSFRLLLVIITLLSIFSRKKNLY